VGNEKEKVARWKRLLPRGIDAEEGRPLDNGRIGRGKDDPGPGKGLCEFR
jgi:hypothetical protein